MTDVPNPWQTIGSEIKYQNEWISLREDRVIEPDGKERAFAVATFNPGVSVLPVDDDGSVYLVKQYRYGAECVTTEVVAGGLRPGETADEAARRELSEETGLIAREFIPLGFTNPFTSIAKSRNDLYIARGLSQGKDNRDVTELLEIIKVPYQQALDWVMDNTITHSPSVATILKARNYL